MYDEYLAIEESNLSRTHVIRPRPMNTVQDSRGAFHRGREIGFKHFGKSKIQPKCQRYDGRKSIATSTRAVRLAFFRTTAPRHARRTARGWVQKRSNTYLGPFNTAPTCVYAVQAANAKPLCACTLQSRRHTHGQSYND